jgi:hypothetical protein
MPFFSQRHGYDPPKEIAFREELPAKLRTPILEIVGRHVSDRILSEAIKQIVDPYGMDDPSTQAALVATMQNAKQNAILMREGVAPVSGPKALLLTCPWFRVYDFIEEILRQLAFHEIELRTDTEEEVRAGPLRRDLNDYFVYAAIGWQIVEEKVVTRRDEAFEVAVKTAVLQLQQDGRTTAAGQIRDGLQALSRRPEADLRGAIIHGMGALECIARELANEQKLTLGDVLKRHPNLLPKPVGEALSKLWGYASNEARHVTEGREPNMEEAELMVGLAASVATYLTRKHRRSK